MANAYYQIREPENEPHYQYTSGSPERKKLKKELDRLSNKTIGIPAIIGGEEVKTDNTADVVMPHDHQHKLADVHLCGEKEVQKAADLISGPQHYRLNAAAMLGQSKNPYESEIDAIAEVVDFFRFNCYYLTQIYGDQPYSPNGIWNRIEYRPLEGFIFAVMPFNFTSIGANLPTAPVICGNVSLWEPSTTSIYSNYFVMKILQEAGLPTAS